MKHERRETRDERCLSSIIRRPYIVRKTALLLEFFEKLKCYGILSFLSLEFVSYFEFGYAQMLR
ncbi:hypothetical protein KSMBR1_2407 [Candidatus Kuenenia stuttgartiensis]|uniref:Uncharacterized protein n=1 Tax=Kuenenia stuttgartiensis TaxID=174633 RepID=A0A2C9CGX1_KUEST|nr:hypothetical protein KSMBR1_2407 [Candidatus Kuenenia stuttgartiensis]